MASPFPRPRPLKDFVAVDSLSSPGLEVGVPRFRFFDPELLILLCGKIIEAFQQGPREICSGVTIEAKNL